MTGEAVDGVRPPLGIQLSENAGVELPVIQIAPVGQGVSLSVQISRHPQGFQPDSLRVHKVKNTNGLGLVGWLAAAPAQNDGHVHIVCAQAHDAA